MSRSSIIFYAILTCLFFINLTAYILYAVDKKKAKKSLWRIPEKTLILMAVLGGGLGAWIGMRHFHHKTLHWKFRILVPLFGFLWLFPIGSMVLVYSLQSCEIHYTPLMFDRAREAKKQDKKYQAHFEWVTYSSISPNMVRAVIASEDNLFPTHNGFSEQGIRNAIAEKVVSGEVKHGGSTISQQTAKNVFTFGKRNFFRKIREAWYTFLIETFWSKKRIMEVYLNVIEMGNGIYGAEAASQLYFHHSAKSLSKEEAALIAVCLPNPRRYSVLHSGPYIQKRQRQIINLMPKLGKIELESF